MKARVVGCRGVSGRVEATPSLWDSMVKIVAAAAGGGGEVDNLRMESRCIRDMAKALGGLGYRVEWVSSTRLHIRDEGGEPGSRVVVDTSCGLLVPGLLAPLAAVRLPPGGQFVVRGASRRPPAYSLRPIIEAVTAVGGRAWPGGGPARLIVVEPAAYTGAGRVARLQSPPGYVAAGVLAALAAAGGGRLLVYGSGVKAAKRLESMKHALREAGFRVEEGRWVEVAPGEAGGPRLLRAEPGLHETALLLALASPCMEGGLEVSGLPGGEGLSGLEYLLKASGFEAGVECGRDCSLHVDSFAPSSAVVSLSEDPGYVFFAAAYTAAWARLTVTGLRSAVLEGLLDEGFEAFLHQLGVEVYIEDGDRLVAAEQEPGEPGLARIECGEPAHCVAALARFMKVGRGVVKGVERIEDAAPGVLGSLQSLGAGIDVY